MKYEWHSLPSDKVIDIFRLLKGQVSSLESLKIPPKPLPSTKTQRERGITLWES